MGGKVSKNVVDLEPLMPLPSSDELALIGGRYFTRPSDGRKMEYFILNGGDDDSSPSEQNHRAVVNLVSTNATGRLYHIWKQDEVLQVLKKYDVKLINVSTAGVGPSQPYGTKLNDESVTTESYLEQTSRDVIALLSELGIKEVYTIGVSGGWEPSAHLAATLCSAADNNAGGDQQDSQEILPRVKGVSCVRGIPWMTQDEETEPCWEATFGTGGIKKSLATWFIFSSMSPYLMNMMFPMKPEQMKAHLPNYDEIVKALGDDESLMTEITTEGNRANAHYLFVASFLGRLTCSLPKDRVPKLADLDVLDKKVPVINFHLSTKDEMVPYEKVKPYLTRKLPSGKLFEDDQSHIAVPFVMALEELLK